jgi:hypothetical protein
VVTEAILRPGSRLVLQGLVYHFVPTITNQSIGMRSKYNLDQTSFESVIKRIQPSSL